MYLISIIPFLFSTNHLTHSLDVNKTISSTSEFSKKSGWRYFDQALCLSIVTSFLEIWVKTQVENLANMEDYTKKKNLGFFLDALLYYFLWFWGSANLMTL